MKALRINLLGPPEILWEDQRLNINRRTPRSILYFLAGQHHLIGREKLLSLFWQDTSPQSARKRLRESLSRIRSEIPIENIIVVENDLIGVNHANVTVDFREFYTQYNSLGMFPLNNPSDKILPEKVENSLKRALDLWRGNLFLEGCELPNSSPLEDWRYQANFDLVEKRALMLTCICDHYLAAGQYEQGLSYSRIAIGIDNLNEEFHYRVLRFLVELDRYEEARQYYLSITKLLRAELGIQPSQKLVSIYRQIKRNFQTPIKSPGLDWRELPSIRTPFIGRENELSIMKSTMENGRSILISGESGLGKTRFVQEFYEVYAFDRIIMNTHCRPAEINLPLQPFIEIIRNNNSIIRWKNIPSPWKESLATIMPDVFPRNPFEKNPVYSISIENNRSTLFEAIRQVFVDISRNSDVILVIDDLHWCDIETLSCISYLSARYPFTENAFLVLAARSDEINQTIEDILFADHAASNIEQLVLGQLSGDDISGLGRYVLGYPLQSDLIDQLLNETGGNPFIVLETLHSLHNKEILSGVSGLSGRKKLPLAKSVFTLIKERLGHLSPTAREIGEYAAVYGNEFDPILISEASQLSLSITARAVEELHQRQLVEPIPDPSGDVSWRFRHDKIRETIILDTNRVRLRFLHEQIAHSLEVKFGSKTFSKSAILARHYEYAGNLNPAFYYWLQAARWARQLFSSSEAFRIFFHAEKLVQGNFEIIRDDLIHDFFSEWTELAYEIEDAAEIREHNNRLLDIGQIKQSKLLIGTALVGQSIACLVNNQFEEGLNYSIQAIPYLKDSDHTYEHMNSYTTRGIFQYMLGRLQDAIDSFEFALSLGNSSRDPKTQRGTANAYYQLALSQTLGGWPELGLMNARNSLEIATSIGHHHIAVTAYLASSLAYYFMDDYKKGRFNNDAGIEIARKLHANRMLGYLYASKAFLEFADGNLGSAYELTQEINKIALKSNYQELQSLAHRLRGDIYIMLQSYEEALEEFQLGVELGTHDFWGLDNLVRKGYSQIRIGYSEKGMTNLMRGIELAKSAGFGMVQIRGLLFLGNVYAIQGETEKTIKLTDQLDKLARVRYLPIISIVSKQLRISVSMGEMQPDAAIEQLNYLMKLIGDLGQPYIAIRILSQLVRLENFADIDSTENRLRIHQILDQCEQLAYPDQIQASFQRYKNEITSLITI